MIKCHKTYNQCKSSMIFHIMNLLLYVLMPLHFSYPTFMTISISWNLILYYYLVTVVMRGFLKKYIWKHTALFFGNGKVILVGNKHKFINIKCSANFFCKLSKKMNQYNDHWTSVSLGIWSPPLFKAFT